MSGRCVVGSYEVAGLLDASVDALCPASSTVLCRLPCVPFGVAGKEVLKNVIFVHMLGLQYYLKPRYTEIDTIVVNIIVGLSSFLFSRFLRPVTATQDCGAKGKEQTVFPVFLCKPL